MKPRCLICSAEAKGERLPSGWHRKGDEVYCAADWRERYILRAVTIPVASPLSGTWEEFGAALKQIWALSTAASNWIMTEFYARDVRRNGEAKMPPMQRVYLYPETTKRFPELPTQAAASLEHSIGHLYRKQRYEIVWTCSRTLASLRYPQPFPIHNQSWGLSFDGGGRPVASVRLSDQRWSLRLRGGARYQRQTAALKQIVSGAALKGAAAIYRRGDQVMLKMVAWLPRSEAQARSDTLTVRTAERSLLIALDKDREKIWTFNGDHIVRWIAQYEAMRGRLMEDRKAENRPVPTFQAHWDRMVEKQRARMKSAAQQIAAYVGGFAKRRRFATVLYDDSCRQFAGDGFPYFQMALAIKTKLNEFGIDFQASGESVQKEPEPLAEGQDE